MSLAEVGLILAAHDERERRMDLRFGLLGAALINTLAQVKRPVTPADIFPSLAPDDELPDDDTLTRKLGAAFGLEL